MDIGIQAQTADTFFSRLRGLLGRDAEQLGGLLITPCNQIHTCFMSYPIDVVYLNSRSIITRIDEAVPAWKLCKAEHGAKSVVELPAYRARELNMQIGDRVVVRV